MEQRCHFCEMIAGGKKPANLILENDFAFGIFAGYYREGHSTVVLKRHTEAFSEMRPLFRSIRTLSEWGSTRSGCSR